MKTKLIALRYASLAMLALFTASCATPALWKQTAAREWKPNPPDQVIVVTDTNQQREVVVVFRQFATCGRTFESRDVALPVSRTNCSMALSSETIGALTNSAGQCRCIPVYFDRHVPQNSAPSSGYATWDPMEQQLTVHAADAPAGPFKLPTSHQKQKTAARLCGLPFAVAADAAIVGAALFLVGMSGYVGP